MPEALVNNEADSSVAKAQQFFMQGQTHLAEIICRQVLEVQPLHTRAWVLSGLIAARKGDLSAALVNFRTAIQSDSQQPDIHFRAGLLHQQLGEDSEALACFEQSELLAPGHVALWLAQGISLRNLARYKEALSRYDRALSVAPGNAQVLNNRAVTLRQLGRLEEAVEGFSKALNELPESASIHNNLGVTLHQLARLEDALDCLQRALAIKPGDPELLSNLGMTLHELSRYEEAQAAYALSLKADPSAWQTLMNLGVTQSALKQQAKALVTLDRASAICPGDSNLRMNRANVLMELGRHEEALHALMAVAVLRPVDAELQMNIGNNLREMQRHGEAMQHYDQAMNADPGNPDVHWNRSLCLLTMGDYPSGWAEYEWRTKARKLGRVERTFAVPKWLGAEPLMGKTILLYAEQGLGDTLWMCRYAAPVARLGAKVFLQVQKPLLDLLKCLEGVSLLFANGDALPEFDLHCPLMSLPHALGTTIDTVPAAVPYLHPDAQRVARWRACLDARRLRVGVVWEGNAANAMDHKRSLPLETFLQALPDGPQYWCLQKEVAAHDHELLQASGKIQCFDETDFPNTAAQIASMDVVVSVDTSIAHLAAAMGSDLWLLVAFAADFRWLSGRNDSVWYPTARLFRQPQVGDWVSVMTEIKCELIRLNDRGCEPL